MKQSRVMAITAFVAAFAAASAAFQVNSHHSLKSKAKITEEQARTLALAAVPGATIVDAELEKEDGAIIWTFDLRVAGVEGTSEVHVDAVTGKVGPVTVENDEDEDRDEDAKDNKE